MPSDKDDQHTSVLLAEYQAAQACFLHYDDFRWKSGSMLFAGTMLYWTFFIDFTIKDDFNNYCDSTKFYFIIIGSMFVIGILSGWVFYAYHYRYLYMCKLNRINEIESILHMEQHLRLFQASEQYNYNNKLDNLYKIPGPKGHLIDIFVYFWASSFGPLSLYIIHDYNYRLLSPVILIILVVVINLLNNRKLNKSLIRINNKIYKKELSG